MGCGMDVLELLDGLLDDDNLNYGFDGQYDDNRNVEYDRCERACSSDDGNGNVGDHFDCHGWELSYKCS